MNTLLHQVQIIDSNSTFDNQIVDVLIENNAIKTIATKIEIQENTTVINGENLALVPAFCDLYVQICDLGLEHRDDIFTTEKSALAGGFTTICAIANNQPITQNKTQVEYIINRAKQTNIQILPIGAATENFDGKTPTEILDMNNAGAIAFSDMPNAIKDSGVMLRLLQYVLPFNGLIISMAYDKTLVADGLINEGNISVKTGMRGISNLSEFATVQRDIELLKYTGGKLHLTGISTKESVDLIRKAKAEKLNITASVFVHHLISTEVALKNYDSNFKVFPPLRTLDDQNALIEGLQDGTIDCISTQHTPIDIDAKNIEFEYAEFGIIGLESAFGLLYKRLENSISKQKLIELLSTNPRKIINQNSITIEENASANFVLVDFNKEWIFEEKDIQSKSKNTPFIGTQLKGKIIQVIQ